MWSHSKNFWAHHNSQFLSFCHKGVHNFWCRNLLRIFLLRINSIKRCFYCIALKLDKSVNTIFFCTICFVLWQYASVCLFLCVSFSHFTNSQAWKWNRAAAAFRWWAPKQAPTTTAAAAPGGRTAPRAATATRRRTSPNAAAKVIYFHIHPPKGQK